jgi:hypothetical protein
MVKHVCILRELQLKSELQQLELDRPHYKRLASCVIAQQYSSFTAWLRLHSHKKNVGAMLKNVILFSLFFIKNSEIVYLRNQ